MPTATTSIPRGTPYTRLPASALDYAVTRRQSGLTYPAILRELSLLGYEHDGYDANLLAHHVRRHSGGNAPRATRRTTTTARRAAAAWGTGRRFGVEIEVAGLTETAAYNALRAAGVNVEMPGYTHRVMSCWKIVHDASVSGCEVVSPPMADVAEVGTVTAALRAAGGRVDRTTGLHVHHEATDLTAEALATLVLVMADCAEDLNGCVAPCRRPSGVAGGWGRPRGAHEAERTAASIRRLNLVGTPDQKRRAFQSVFGGREGGDRYRSLNVQSYGTYGTVEFRQHQGTLNAAKVTRWVTLGQAILSWCAANEGRRLTAGTLLATLVAEGHLDATTARRLPRAA